MNETEKRLSPTSIRLSPKIYAKIVEEAKKDKRSLSKQIEYVIEKYYEIKEDMNK